jgi:hypothetical protein
LRAAEITNCECSVAEKKNTVQSTFLLNFRKLIVKHRVAKSAKLGMALF